ncbi:MAG: PH domain-containing protein [Ornithinimicrobium sp.]
MSDLASPATSAAARVDAPDQAARLREPAHYVAPEAVRYWALKSLVGAVIQWFVVTALYVFAVPDDWKVWAGPVAVALVAISIVELAVVPQWRYRVYRWEVTDTAIYTRSGWFTREQRIAPLSRVQTVDSERGPLMRLFRLSSITVTTASAAGPITIDCLNSDVAARVVADLTEITARTEGDAT